MASVDIETIETPSLEDPVLLEGLPGVANVGALAAGHLIDAYDATLVRRIYSEHFPPQVMIEGRSATLTGTELHAIDLEGRDVLVLTGDHQPQTPIGHYRVTEAFLDVAESFGVSEIIAMGGVPTGELIDEYDVLGAATDDAFADRLEEAGVIFREDEPAGGIIGISGLLLGLGARRDLPAACLMGETSGYLVDPMSATRLLEVLQTLYDFSVDTGSLDERAEEMEEVLNKIQEFEAEAHVDVPGDEDLRYIG